MESSGGGDFMEKSTIMKAQGTKHLGEEGRLGNERGTLKQMKESNLFHNRNT